MPEKKDTVSEPSPCACGAESSEDELLERLDQLLETYRDIPGALIPVLQLAQSLFGYLPEAVLKRISLAMNRSYSEVAGVVTFYSFFSTQPRGRYLVRVCLGTACYVRGGAQVLEAIKQKLGVEVGGTTPDRVFTLEIGRCFGACGMAPVIMVNNDVHQRVNPNKLEQIFSTYRDREAIVVKTR